MAVRRFNSTETRTLGRNELRKQGTEVFRSTRPTKIESANDDLVITADEGDRMDLLAAQFYGSPRLWWVIASVNNITNGSMHIRPGTRLRIPARNRIL